MDLTMNYDVNKANLRKLNNKSIYFYSEEQSQWIELYNVHYKTDKELGGQVMTLGRYAILGRRR